MHLSALFTSWINTWPKSWWPFDSFQISLNGSSMFSFLNAHMVSKVLPFSDSSNQLRRRDSYLTQER